MPQLYNNKLLLFIAKFRIFPFLKRPVFRFLLLPSVLVLAVIVVCPYLYEKRVEIKVKARLYGQYFVATDAVELPMHAWIPENQPPKVLIVAVHGFNDYGNFFAGPGNYFKDFGIASYAYDQRGFGGAPKRGSWAGIQVYIHDLAEFVSLVRQRHPGIPLYLLGESMGAAEIISVMTSNQPPLVDGLILSAPAVWEWKTVPLYRRIGFWFAAHTVPWLHLTGASRHLVPSDNIEMLRALRRDPLILKETRIGTVYGLTNLMSQAFSKIRQLDKSTLILYGERDTIVPRRFVYEMLKTLPPNKPLRVAFYSNGYHMLLRDLEAFRQLKDIVAWINNHNQPLPSGADQRAMTVLAGSP